MNGKRKEEAKRWFGQAKYDLHAAQWNMEGEFFNTACFPAQQSAEKVLKSFLYYVGARRKALLTHSLVEMAGEGGKKLDALLSRLEDARKLDMHHIPSLSSDFMLTYRQLNSGSVSPPATRESQRTQRLFVFLTCRETTAGQKHAAFGKGVCPLEEQAPFQLSVSPDN